MKELKLLFLSIAVLFGCVNSYSTVVVHEDSFAHDFGDFRAVAEWEMGGMDEETMTSPSVWSINEDLNAVQLHNRYDKSILCDLSLETHFNRGLYSNFRILFEYSLVGSYSFYNALLNCYGEGYGWKYNNINLQDCLVAKPEVEFQTCEFDVDEIFISNSQYFNFSFHMYKSDCTLYIRNFKIIAELIISPTWYRS